MAIEQLTIPRPQWVTQALGIPTDSGSDMYNPYAGMAFTQRPQMEQAPQQISPSQAAAMRVANSSYLGGDNAFPTRYTTGDAASDFAAKEAGRRARIWNMAQAAVAARKREQWENGQRSLADEMPGAQVPDYARSAQPLNPYAQNGVSNGIAYKSGNPVGFAGAVPGMQSGVPEAGFTPPERSLMQLAMAQQEQAHPPIMRPQVMPTIGAEPAQVTPSDMGSAVESTPAAMAPEVVYDDGRTLAQREVSRRNLMRSALGNVDPMLPYRPPARATVNELNEYNDNIKRGMKAREDADKWDKAIPGLIPELSELAGIDIDKNILANEIMNYYEPDDNKSGKKKTPNAGIISAIAKWAFNNNVGPRVLHRWAKDHLSGK